VSEREEKVGPTPTDAVLVDVGRGTGALVVLAPRERVGARIDLIGADGRDRHVDVLERSAPAGPVAAAVFGSIPAGAYEIAFDAGGRVGVEVPEGVVAEVDLRNPSSAGGRA
jgi:hypothetical protein